MKGISLLKVTNELLFRGEWLLAQQQGNGETPISTPIPGEVHLQPPSRQKDQRVTPVAELPKTCVVSVAGPKKDQNCLLLPIFDVGIRLVLIVSPSILVVAIMFSHLP